MVLFLTLIFSPLIYFSKMHDFNMKTTNYYLDIYIKRKDKKLSYIVLQGFKQLCVAWWK